MTFPAASSPGLRRSTALVAVLLAALATMPAPRADPSALIRNNGSSENRVDLVILGDGYTAAEIDAGKYANDVEQFVQGMFQQEHYREYQNYFNVLRIDTPSAESGADHPERTPKVYKNTAFDATYNCSGIQRLICINTSKVNTVLANTGIAANARDAVVVIVNDTEYGGSGGSIAVASINGAVIELVLHEMGHSFGQLTDEYGGPPPPSCSGAEPSGANATRETVRELIKWNVWIDPNTPVPTYDTVNGVPGLYQGAAYCDTGAYRPIYNSKMRSLGQAFHQINSEQHVRRIYNFVSPIDDSSPSGTVIAAGPSQAFAVWIPQPYTHNLDVTWRVDGAVQASGTTYTASGFGPGDHTVTATVGDPTSMVRNDPAGLLQEVRTWTVNFQIAAAPTITLQPVSRTIVEGFGTTFTAAATSAITPMWRWQVSVDGGLTWIDLTDGAPYSGVQTATLVVTGPPKAASGNRYRAAATNPGGTAWTNAALLTVYGLGTNVLQNGDFSAGPANWQFFELPDITWNISGGVMEFYRASTPATASGQATVFQQTGVEIGAGGSLLARFDLGNSSSARKRISVLILDSDFSDLSVCTFWLPPGAPMRTFAMSTHPTQAWKNAAIYFYGATTGSDGGAYQVDNVSLQVDPAGATDRTGCSDPNAPVPTGGADGPELLTNGDFGAGTTEGWSLYGQLLQQVDGGVFEFYRPAAAPDPAGVILQPTGTALAAGEILTARFDLGNSSAVRKRVTVLLHDLDFSDLSACTFWLAPGQAPSTYAMRSFATQAWTNTTISIYAATVGDDTWTRLDNVSLKKTPGGVTTGTDCVEPSGTLAAPAVQTGTAATTADAGTTSAPMTDPNATGTGFSAVVDPLSGDIVGWQIEATTTGTFALAWPTPVDLRDGTSASLHFESLLAAVQSAARVQVSLDGLAWTTLATLPPSSDWLSVELDLAPYGGQVIYLRFVFDAAPAANPPGPTEVWRIRATDVRRPSESCKILLLHR